MTEKHLSAPVARIPSIDALLRADPVLSATYGHAMAVDALRKAAAALREQTTAPDAGGSTPDPTAWILEHAHERCARHAAPSLKPVLNLTGTVLHTNLGRAPLPEVCIEAVTAVARGASNLEFRLDEGRRGDRDEHIEARLCELTGAEAATVVNNNAAAVLLTLNALAEGKPVAVSRGELVEIGGSFRIPDIMRRAHCTLVEVGTTNRTHLKDYIEAVDDGASAVMRVHTSNYVVQGFTSAVPDNELAELARDRGVIFINDLGSGALVDMTAYGLPHEATPAEALADGADVVTFSGDKLLGGPQCGLIVGKRDVVERIRRSPMKRAMRCDKMTLAALESILAIYSNPDRLVREVPALRLLTRALDDIEHTAHAVREALEARFGDDMTVRVAPCASQIGSGALPVDTLPSAAVVLEPAGGGHALQALASAFRKLPLPVVGRIQDGALQFDVRCLEAASDLIDQLGSLEY